MCVALMLVAVIAVIPASEPSHEGRTLSEWLATIEKEDDLRDSDNPVAVAVRDMGQEAIPFLLERIAIRNGSPFPTRIDEFLIQLNLRPDTWSSEQFFARMRLKSEAIAGFRILGTNAQSAISELTALLADDDATASAGGALAVIGEGGLETLLEQLNSPDPIVRKGALMGMESPQENDTRNIKALIEIDPNGNCIAAP